MIYRGAIIIEKYGDKCVQKKNSEKNILKKKNV